MPARNKTVYTNIFRIYLNNRLKLRWGGVIKNLLAPQSKHQQPR